MATTITADDLARLSIEERYKLLELVMESIAGDSAEQLPPEWHLAIVRERVKKYRENPGQGVDVDEFLDSLEAAE